MKKLLLFSLFFATTMQSKNITVFAHGIVDDSSQCQRFQKAISTPILALNFSDTLQPSGNNFNSLLFNLCSYFGKKVNRNAMFMGQKNDIDVARNAISLIEHDTQIILYGCSRGAATLVSYIGTDNPENIAALILDACPASMPETIQMALAQVGIDPNHCSTIFSYLFPQYDHLSAITPLAAIAHIKNKQLPILLIHSVEDTKVHYTQSLKLYQAFLDAGFTNVELCLIAHGRHSYLLQDESSAKPYLETIHNFYKKYNLPYDQDFATKDLVTKSKLNPEKIKKQIESYEQKILATYHKASTRNSYYPTTIIMLSILYWFVKNNSL